MPVAPHRTAAPPRAAQLGTEPHRGGHERRARARAPNAGSDRPDARTGRGAPHGRSGPPSCATPGAGSRKPTGRSTSLGRRACRRSRPKPTPSSRRRASRTGRDRRVRERGGRRLHGRTSRVPRRAGDVGLADHHVRCRADVLERDLQVVVARVLRQRATCATLTKRGRRALDLDRNRAGRPTRAVTAESVGQRAPPDRPSRPRPRSSFRDRVRRRRDRDRHVQRRSGLERATTSDSVSQLPGRRRCRRRELHVVRPSSPSRRPPRARTVSRSVALRFATTNDGWPTRPGSTATSRPGASRGPMADRRDREQRTRCARRRHARTGAALPVRRARERARGRRRGRTRARRAGACARRAVGVVTAVPAVGEYRNRGCARRDYYEHADEHHRQRSNPSPHVGLSTSPDCGLRPRAPTSRSAPRALS